LKRFQYYNLKYSPFFPLPGSIGRVVSPTNPTLCVGNSLFYTGPSLLIPLFPHTNHTHTYEIIILQPPNVVFYLPWKKTVAELLSRNSAQKISTVYFLCLCFYEGKSEFFFIQNLARKTECLLHSVLVYYNSLTRNLPDPFCREPSFPFFACFLMPQESIPCSQFAICTKLLIDVNCMSVECSKLITLSFSLRFLFVTLSRDM